MRKYYFKIAIIALIVILFAQSIPAKVEAEDVTLTGKTAVEITSMMGKGWNLGNALDATGGNGKDIYSHETSWGNPKITKELIKEVKAAGFNTIRIPITWEKYIDTDNGYAINPEFMARVKEIVDYAYEEGFFIIINVHHEEWVNRADFYNAYTEIGEQLTAVWKQVSEVFADYDQHLIFEGMNEPRAKGTSYEWNGNIPCYKAIEYLNQLFVETIRENGKGYNNERMLMIPGYAASSNTTVLNSIKIPEINGEQATNICVSVHCYSPYNFCLSDKQTTFDPENGDGKEIDNLFNKLQTLFLDKGIPVVIGECGATNSGNNNDARRAWFAYMGAISEKYGVPAVLWDNGNNGNSGGECHYYFNRKTAKIYAEDLINAFISGSVTGEKETAAEIESTESMAQIDNIVDETQTETQTSSSDNSSSSSLIIIIAIIIVVIAIVSGIIIIKKKK